MIFVSFAWLAPDENEFSLEANAPFEFVGQQLTSFAFHGRFLLIFLAGYRQLSSSYRSRLERLGFELVDYTAEKERLATQFPGLQRFESYGYFCFLRWIALRAFLHGEGSQEQVIHLDGDVVFNTSPAEIAEDLTGLTFVLQGCPAVTSISNQDWLADYEQELLIFSRDIDRYCAAAFRDRGGWLTSAREKWTGVWQGPEMTHDQDLICYLIHANKLAQNRPETFARDLKLYYTQNPYWLHEGAETQLGRDSNLTFSSRDHVCYLEDKKIALWHFQSFFASQLAGAIELHQRGHDHRYPNPSDPLLAELKATKRNRKELYLLLSELNPGNPEATFSFADLYNRERYWHPDVFSNSEAT